MSVKTKPFQNMAARSGSATGDRGMSLLLRTAAAFTLVISPVFGPAHADALASNPTQSHAETPNAETITVKEKKTDAQPPTKAFISIDPKMAADQETLNVSQTSKKAPALLSKAGSGIPLAIRFFQRQSVPDATNYFTRNGAPTYVDGVYYNKPYGALYDFIDLDEITFLPSAQGSLFGQNSIDGAILITTKQPGPHFAATADVTYGTNNWYDVRGAISAPIVDDKLAVSFSGLLRSRDGLVSAPALYKDVNNRDYQAARAKLFFTPSDDLDVTVSLDGLRDRSSPKYPSSLSPFAAGQDPAAQPNRDIFTTEAISPDLNRLDQQGVAIVTNYRFEDFAIKSITGYRDTESTSYVTYDATAANVLSTEAIVHQNQLTEDLSVSGGNDWLRGTAGLYFMRKDTKQRTPTGSAPNFSRELAYSYAGYGQIIGTIAEGVDLIAGFHYSITDEQFGSDFYAGNKKATQFGHPKPIPASLLSPQTDSDTWYGFTPKFGLNWQITPDLLAYASYTRGFKDGGWNNRLPPNYDSTGVLIYRPLRYLAEAADEYEVGAKVKLLDNKLDLHLSAYINDYKNLQIPVLLYGSSTYYLTSAPKSQITGVEIGPTWQATDELELYGLIALQHGNYQGKFLCQNSAGIKVDCSASPLIGLAPLRVLAGLSYAPRLPIPGQVRLGFSANYSDKYQNSISGVELAATGSRTLFDASVNYELPGGHWTFSVEGRNLTDVHWFSTAVQNGHSVAVYPDDPRTVIGRAKYTF